MREIKGAFLSLLMYNTRCHNQDNDGIFLYASHVDKGSETTLVGACFPSVEYFVVKKRK
jgi:hypothetical protein